MRGRAEAASAGSEKKNTKDKDNDNEKVNSAKINSSFASSFAIQPGPRRTIGRTGLVYVDGKGRGRGHQIAGATGKMNKLDGHNDLRPFRTVPILCTATRQSTVTVAVGL